MNEIANTHLKESEFRLRLWLMIIFALITLLVIFAQLFRLQVVNHEAYQQKAAANQIKSIPIQPSRGEIIDRNGIVLADNYIAHSLELTIKDLTLSADAEPFVAIAKNKRPEDTYQGYVIMNNVNRLRDLVSITDQDLKKFWLAYRDIKGYESIPLKLNLSEKEAAILAARLWQYPGVDIKAKMYREYPHGELTSHVIGYIGRINLKEKKEIQAGPDDDNYQGANHIGKTGLELSYEKELRGLIGYDKYEVRADGKMSKRVGREESISGQTLRLSLDIRMQEVVDKLFGARRGALVAIDPQNGEVLAFVSKPTFDPNLFVNGISSQDYASLRDNWQIPLLNRATLGTYPPGSIFKPFFGMVALEENGIGPYDVRPAPGVFYLPGSSHMFRDSVPSGHGSANLSKAIQVSSDTFFYKLAWDIGIDRMSPGLALFGLGSKTHIDLPAEKSGILPSKTWLKQARGEEWKPSQVISVGIGQGYNTYTPLQMAHATAILAANGKVFRPHLVKKHEESTKASATDVEPILDRVLPYKQAHFDYIKQSMVNVLKPGGTAWRLGQALNYPLAGKTGTAQVVAIAQGGRYNAAALAESNRDHSWFIAFAPVQEARIAIAVIVENAGFGATAAAPIAKALTDFYMEGKIPPELVGHLKTIPGAVSKIDPPVLAATPIP